jgi:Bifunctional DNA primase/polymerase, N-terminal
MISQSMLRAALGYARRGLLIFPVRPGRKEPLTAHGCHEGTSDPAQILDWWERWPKANVGLSTGKESNVVVVDYDVKKGKRGLESLASILDRFQIQTLSARTPSGGIHQYFRYPGDVLRNGVERLPGVDLRTSGGYVLVPPSTVDGEPYTWVERRPPAEMPAGLIELLRPPETPVAPSRPYRAPADREGVMNRVRAYLCSVPPAVEGEGGDEHTYRLACRLVRGFGLSEEEALGALLEWNRDCVPPWSERELRKKIAGAQKYGNEPIGARLEVR